MIQSKIFYSCSSLSAWANGQIHYFGGNVGMPYVEGDRMWYYFGVDDHGVYHLLMTSSVNLED